METGYVVAIVVAAVGVLLLAAFVLVAGLRVRRVAAAAEALRHRVDTGRAELVAAVPARWSAAGSAAGSQPLPRNDA